MSTPNTPVHTPAPWSYFRSDGTIAAGTPAHTIARANYGDNWQANAAHIVLCVNSHDKLREACRSALDYVNLLIGDSPTVSLATQRTNLEIALKESEAK